MIYVVGALIQQSNKFLITKRAHGELKGTWEFPGGKIEEKETEFEAIKREIQEELGLKIIPKKIVNTFKHSYSFGEIQLTLIKCELENESQSIISDGSHTEYKWITIKEIDSIIFAPLDQKIITYLQK